MDISEKLISLSKKLKNKRRYSKDLSRFYKLAREVSKKIPHANNVGYHIEFLTNMHERGYFELMADKPEGSIRPIGYKFNINDSLRYAGDKVIRGVMAHEFSHSVYGMGLLLKGYEEEIGVHMYAIANGFSDDLIALNDFVDFQFKYHPHIRAKFQVFTNNEINEIKDTLEGMTLKEIVPMAKACYVNLKQFHKIR